MKPIFNVPGESAVAMILGTISGYPVGAKVVCNLKKQKVISKIEAERLISYTNNSGPLFILGTVGIALFGDKRIGIILLVSHILASVLVAYCFRFWKKDKIDISYMETKFNSQITPLKVSDMGEILGNSIKNAISSILLIGGFVVIFSVILSILETSGILEICSQILAGFGIKKEISLGILSGIIELTNGVNKVALLSNSYYTLSILIASFLLGFGGISVLMQVYSIIVKEDISIKPYLYGKILQGIFSACITFILI